jgi:hypothetical protein
MLFDLRGRGRRRTVQVIYASLAILLGGGLVFFGIGGDVQGGLFDAFSQDSGSENEAIERQVDDAEERVQANRSDPASWAALAQARYQLAGASDGFNEETGEFTGESRERLVEAVQAWETHLRLAEDKPDANVAAVMQQAYLALDQAEKAVRTQEIVIDSLPNPGYGDYAKLAQLAYIAGQTRKGDLATQRALDDAKEEGVEKATIDELRTTLESVKQQAAQQAVEEAQGGAGGGASGGSPTPIAP